MGWDVHTLDHNPKCQPTICCDLLQWDFSRFPPGYFDVVVASPPCEQFSHANHSRPQSFHMGDCLVLQTLRIIEHLKPKAWLMENPRTGDLVHRPFMQKIPHADFDYCMFSDWGYKKPTRIWGSEQLSHVQPRICNGTCPNMAKFAHGQAPRHKQWLGGHGPQPSVNLKFRIPENLVLYLIDQMKLNQIHESAKEIPPSSPHHEASAVRVVTRHAEYTSGEESSDAELEPVVPPPLHPPRSTLGKRRASQAVEPPSPPLPSHDEEGDVIFYTPPGTPKGPSEVHFEPEFASTSSIPPHTWVEPSERSKKLRSEQAENSERPPSPPSEQPPLPSQSPPPPSKPPLRFFFKHLASSSASPPQEEAQPEAQAPVAQRAPRQKRPDEAAAIPDGASARLPSLVEDPGSIFDVEWDAWYEKCPTWSEAHSSGTKPRRSFRFAAANC